MMSSFLSPGSVKMLFSVFLCGGRGRIEKSLLLCGFKNYTYKYTNKIMLWLKFKVLYWWKPTSYSNHIFKTCSYKELGAWKFSKEKKIIRPTLLYIFLKNFSGQATLYNSISNITYNGDPQLLLKVTYKFNYKIWEHTVV